ncbi:MAG: tandem-95 repeat protein, partial [Chloroflexi bacterium]|nr:tandem-95 repeat protein [Chloroflexota bacterium]
GDVDGDGDLDLAVGNAGGQNVVYLNDGDGTFDTTSYNFGTGSDWTRSVALGDVDGDGDLDLAVGNQCQQNVVYLNEAWPDLAITKVATPVTALPGDTITYTLAFSNTGGSTATGVVITDTIPVSVTGTSVSSVGASITLRGGTRYAWDVDDLAPGAGGVITISGVLSYGLSAGPFTNTATITTTTPDSNANNNSDDASVEVLEAAPVADDDTFGVDEDSSLNPLDVLDGDTDANGDPLTITAIGALDNGGAVVNGSTVITYTPLAGFVGDEVFTYTVSDGVGYDTASVTVTVDNVNDPPVADDDVFSVDEDSSDNPLDVLDGDTDIDGGALTVSAVGTPDSGGAVVNGSTVVTYTPLADYVGDEVFTYTVSDGNGGYDTAIVTVTVDNVNDPPVADDDTFNVDEDSVDNPLDVLDGDTDVEGDTLTISAVGAPDSGGTVVNGGTVVTYTPPANYVGAEALTYTAGDGNGGYDTATVTVTVDNVNDPPVADDDTFNVDEDSIDNPLDVLDGDVDIDGDTLTISAVGTPDSGGAVVNGGTVITYTPAANFFGAETFTYTVSDGNGGTDTATVNVTVSGGNIAPVADDDTFAVAENAVLTVSVPGVLLNDSDANGDSLIAITDTLPAHGTLTPTIVSWAMNTPETAGDVGRYTSLVIINGKPAISYMDFTNGRLEYVQAMDARGTTWGTPVTVDAADFVGQSNSLAMVNGKPAISYYDWTNQDLKYVQATDADGSSWGTPIVVDTDGKVGPYYTSLVVVNGKPAISYYDGTNSDLKYVHATDADGSSWGTPVLVDSDGTVGQYNSLAVVNGKPAISYFDATGGTLNYARAADVDGSSWITLTTVFTADGAISTLAVINGKPAIAFIAQPASLMYVQAADADGNSWEMFTLLDIGNLTSYASSLAVVDGKPTINYYDYGNGDLKYMQAADADGSSWEMPVAVDTDGTASYSSLAEVDGKPAISYYDSSNGDLKYTRYEPGWKGGFVYRPEADFCGEDSFTYHANDESLDSNVATVTITVNCLNDPPVAADDNYTTTVNTTLTVPVPGVLLNDTDADSDPLTAVWDTGPVSGSLSLSTDGSFIYTPTVGFSGIVSFTYHANDGTDDSNVATVTIAVEEAKDVFIFLPLVLMSD